MLRKLIRVVNGNQKGITGLETAIILIAFVVVAAVFAYSILSAGLFSSQKSSEAVYKGLNEARGTIIIKGSVIATAVHTGANGYISTLTFTVANAMGGEPVDFTPPSSTGTDGKAPSGSPNKVVISYIDPYQKVDDLYWRLTKLGGADSDNLLEEGEQFQITIGETLSNVDSGAGAGNLIDALTTHLGVNTKFTLELKSPVGATLSFERTTPDTIEACNNLQ